MGFYQEQLLPRIQNKVMDAPDMRVTRARVCADLAGTVVEVGFGTGLNAPHYPTTVTKVSAIEPSEVCVRLARARVQQSTAAVEFAGLTGEALDLPSDAFDRALSTWTLCTIPGVDDALAELYRVLKPGGTFHFVEHGKAADPGVLRWQGRVERPWKHVAGGCHLTRPIGDLVERAGFRVDRLETYYMRGEPKVFGYTYEGVATKV